MDRHVHRVVQQRNDCVLSKSLQDSLAGTQSSESNPAQASRRTPAPVQTRELGVSEGFQEETLEGEAVAGPIPSPTGHKQR